MFSPRDLVLPQYRHTTHSNNVELIIPDLFTGLYSITITHFEAQVVPDLAMEASQTVFCVLLTCFVTFWLNELLQTYLIYPCPSLGRSHFSKEPQFLLVEGRECLVLARETNFCSGLLPCSHLLLTAFPMVVGSYYIFFSFKMKEGSCYIFFFSKKGR